MRRREKKKKRRGGLIEGGEVDDADPLDVPEEVGVFAAEERAVAADIHAVEVAHEPDLPAVNVADGEGREVDDEGAAFHAGVALVAVEPDAEGAVDVKVQILPVDHLVQGAHADDEGSGADASHVENGPVDSRSVRGSVSGSGGAGVGQT